ETAGRCVGGSCVAISPGENRRDFLGRELAASNIDHRRHHRPHQVPQETRRRDAVEKNLVVARPLAGDHAAHGGRHVSAERAEPGEVVLANQDVGGAVHRREIELVADVPAVAILEGGRDLAIQHAIFIHARAGGAARVEIFGCGRDLEHHDVGRQRRVQSTLQLGGVERARNRNRRDLPARMHARVGAARTEHPHRGGENPLERGFDPSLYRIVARLKLPSGIVAAVVLERELEDHARPDQARAGELSASVSAIHSAPRAARRALSNTHHNDSESARGSTLTTMASWPTASITPSGSPSSAIRMPGATRSNPTASSPLLLLSRGRWMSTVSAEPCRTGIAATCTESAGAWSSSVATCAAIAVATERSCSRMKALKPRWTSSSSSSSRALRRSVV